MRLPAAPPASQPAPAAGIKTGSESNPAAPMPTVTATAESSGPASSQPAICSPLVDHELAELSGIVSSPYTGPPVGREERHHGVDFAYYKQAGRETIAGEQVRAVLSGVAAAVLVDSFPYGNAVIVESELPGLQESWQMRIQSFTEELATQPSAAATLTPLSAESLYILYAHLQEPPLVQPGQLLAACQPLGAAGKSGNAGVPHLHLEMRLGPAGARFDEMGYYLAEISPAARQSYLSWRISGAFRHFDPLIFLK